MMPTQQTIPILSHVKLDARVMSGSDFVATQTCCQSIERRKLQSAIATDARNRRFAVEIARHKRCDHVTFEITFEIQYVNGNPSSSATRRASYTSSNEQQRDGSGSPFSSTSIPRRWSHNCIVKPTRSCPCSFKIAAAAEESTPPLIATAIFIKSLVSLVSRSELS